VILIRFIFVWAAFGGVSAFLWFRYRGDGNYEVLSPSSFLLFLYFLTSLTPPHKVFTVSPNLPSTPQVQVNVGTGFASSKGPNQYDQL